jgi:hypothetical protein
MTPEEHKRRYQELHDALDQLMADWALHSRGSGCTKCPSVGCLFSRHTITDLMEWSYRQTIEPAELPGLAGKVDEG